DRGAGSPLAPPGEHRPAAPRAGADPAPPMRDGAFDHRVTPDPASGADHGARSDGGAVLDGGAGGDEPRPPPPPARGRPPPVQGRPDELREPLALDRHRATLGYQVEHRALEHVRPGADLVGVDLVGSGLLQELDALAVLPPAHQAV